jgi:SAM-dependent methyltransferase
MRAPVIFDRKLYAARRLKAACGHKESFLARQAGETLAERLVALGKRFRRALDLGSRAESFVLVAPCADHWVRTSAIAGETGESVVADEESLPFAPNSFDLVVSALTLHAINDLPGTLVQIRRALAPGGLFLAALFGGNTLGELRRAFAAGEAEASGGASPRVAPLTDVRDAGALLQRAGFVMSVADVERVTVRYRTFATLVEDLRGLGETNALMQRRRSALSRRVLRAALSHYMEQDGDAEQRLRATFDILYLTGRTERSDP